MAAYLLIDSRDPHGHNDESQLHRLAFELSAKRHTVTLFLVQNAVLRARAGAQTGALADLRAAGVEVLADEFSLRERGIRGDRLASVVAAADLDAVVDRLADGHITLWH